jgi:hypothetical protein
VVSLICEHEGVTDPDAVITYVPALITQLLLTEERLGRPLTEAEVWEVRDRATCMALPCTEHDAFVAARDYRDVDPDNAWEEWSRRRTSTGFLRE